MAKSQINFGELGGGGSQPYYGTESIPTGSSYTTITLPFEPSCMLFWTSDNYSAFYTNDSNAPYDVYLSQGSNSNHYDLPKASRGGYYCEIKNLSGTTLEVWNYGGYTLNYVAYP